MASSADRATAETPTLTPPGGPTDRLSGRGWARAPLAGVWRLAWAEARRARGRFGLLVVALTLLMFLLLFLQTLLGVLLGSFTGALDRQSGEVVVFGADARDSLEASTVTDAQLDAVTGARGVAAAGPIGEAVVSVRVEGRLDDAVLWGYRLGGPGGPPDLSAGRLPTGTGEAVASDADAERGLGLGAVVTTLPGEMPLRVVGLARNAQFVTLPTLFVSFDTFAAARRAANPSATAVPISAIAVDPDRSVPPDQVAGTINRLVPGVHALDRAAAVAAQPGAGAVRSSFALLLGLALIALAAVCGLFFLIATAQKQSTLILLRAVGASRVQLGAALLVQVVVAVMLGGAAATGLLATMAATAGPSLPLTVRPSAVLVVAGGAAVVAALASGGALRRLVRATPQMPPVDLVGGALT